MQNSIKLSILIAGISLLGVTVTANQLNSNLKRPSPKFTKEGLVWGASPMLYDNESSRSYLKFHMKHASTTAYPDFCLSVDLVDTFLDYASRDRCFFRESVRDEGITYLVTDCIYDSEWDELGYDKPVECKNSVTREVIDQYKAGKASRYYGNKPLLPAEQEIDNIGLILFLTMLLSCASGSILTFTGLLLCIPAGTSLLNQPDDQKKKVKQARKDLSTLVRKIANDDFVIEQIHNILTTVAQGEVHERFISPMPAFDRAEWFAGRKQEGKGWIQIHSIHYCESRFAYEKDKQLIDARFKINEDEFMWLIKRLEGGWVKL